MNIIKKILYGMFSLLITSIILVKCLDPMTGSGIDLNPFIAILYFALSVYLIIKGHSIFSAVLSVLLYGILFYMNNKGNSVAMDQFTTKIGTVIGFGIAILVFAGLFSSNKNSSRSGQGSGSVSGSSERRCPICGGPVVWVPEKSVATNRFNDYEKGHWEYDYSEDPHHPTRVWVKEKYHDRIYDTIPAHEECTRCGYGSR